MNVNLLIAQFDELTDSEAMIISFKEFHSILLDNSDIIRVDDDVVQFKSEAGNVTVNIDEINGFQILEKSDVIKKFLVAMCGDQMAKAELIENPTVQRESGLVNVENVPDVNTAIKQWDAYQELCKGLLNETDYQEIFVREKNEDGNYIRVKRHFKKKSAWQKLARAFNVDTNIVDRDIERTKMGKIKEAYYCVRATLPNGRSVESDALCSRGEIGKDKVSDHTIMSTAKTRATNRAIAELIGAGEVSAEEMSAEKKVGAKPTKFLKESDQ